MFGFPEDADLSRVLNVCMIYDTISYTCKGYDNTIDNQNLNNIEFQISKHITCQINFKKYYLSI